MKSIWAFIGNGLNRLATSKRKWLIIFVAALVTRAIGALLGGSGIRRGDDDGMHLSVALNYLSTGSFWMEWEGLKPLYCFQPPGLAVFHLIFLKLFTNYWLAERIFFVLMSAATALAFQGLAERLFKPGIATLATILFILYPPQWFWSTRINSHTYSTNMLVVNFYLLFAMWRNRRWWIAFAIGLLWATMSQMRPEYMLGIFCMALGSALKLRRDGPWIKVPTLLLLGWVVGVSPWVIRNYYKVGHLVVSSTHYAYNFWMVYNDDYTYGGHNFAPSPELDARLKKATEWERTQIWLDEGKNYIKADPGRAVKRTLLNLANFWRPWLSFSDVRLADNLLYIVSWVPIFLLFLAGLFRIPWREPEWFVIWSFMLYKMLAQVPFYMIVRFREAIFPLFLLIAVLPLSAFLTKSWEQEKP